MFRSPHLHLSNNLPFSSLRANLIAPIYFLRQVISLRQNNYFQNFGITCFGVKNVSVQIKLS